MKALRQRTEILVREAITWLEPPPEEVLVMAPWHTQLRSALPRARWHCFPSSIRPPQPGQGTMHPPTHWITRLRRCMQPPPQQYPMVILETLGMTEVQWQPWADWLPTTLQEQGLMMSTSLGPGTASEHVDQPLPQWLDMHDLGDFWLRAGWQDPVIDRHDFVIRFKTSDRCQAFLGQLGASSAQPERKQVTIELITTLCWHLPRKASPQTVEVPISAIRKHSKRRTDQP